MTSLYPKCATTFRQWINSNKKYKQIFVSLGEPSTFDVTLRDGLQALSKSEQSTMTTNNKLSLYHDIVTRHNPGSLEIGSIVSEKVLPIFKDTLEFARLINHYHQENNIHLANKRYILIPNKEKLKHVIDYSLINHFSFITSASNSFQLRNTKKTLADCDDELLDMLYTLDENPNRSVKPTIRLYVSCINECPIEGKISNDFIVDRLLTLNKMDIDDICISDTCGTLEPKDFEYIIDTCKKLGLPMSKLSMHLHVKPDRVQTVEQIIHMALDRKIVCFDVSLLESGGCSVTMNKNMLAPNLSYELYYQSIYNYILKNTD
jgi:hydroxymethylglutaryl-CoA lyase